jgi:hypothetical protein
MDAMRKVVAAVAVSTMLVGCAHSDERLFGRYTAGIGGVSMGLGGVMGLYAVIPPAVADGAEQNDALARDAKIVFFGGLAVAVIGLIFVVAGHRGAKREEAEKSDALHREGAIAYAKAEERERIKRERMWTAMQDAVAAARAGNCGPVIVQARYVYNVDPYFYAARFARDAAISPCLLPPAAQAPAPLAPEAPAPLGPQAPPPLGPQTPATPLGLAPVPAPGPAPVPAPVPAP